MTNETTAPIVSLDVKEIVSNIDMAAGHCAFAAQSFADMCAVFEAIKASAPAGSLIARLAQLGINNCETYDCDFTEYSTGYTAHVERYSVELADGLFRRFHSNMDSSQGGA